MKLLLLLILMAAPTTEAATKEDDALKTAAMAAYKQFGIEDNINEYIKHKVPKKYKELAEKIGPIVDVVVRKKVEYVWKF